MFVLLLTSCTWMDNQYDHGISDNIKHSKENGVFINRLVPTPKSFVFFDTVKFEIAEAWIEKQWMTPDYKEVQPMEEQYQVCLNLKEKCWSLLTYKISIGVDGDRFFAPTSNKSLYSKIDSLRLPLCYKIQKGYKLNPDSEKEIIGEVCFDM